MDNFEWHHGNVSPMLKIYTREWCLTQTLFGLLRFQITKTFSIIATVDKIDILSNQKSIIISLVPHDDSFSQTRLRQSKKIELHIFLYN